MPKFYWPKFDGLLVFMWVFHTLLLLVYLKNLVFHMITGLERPKNGHMLNIIYQLRWIWCNFLTRSFDAPAGDNAENILAQDKITESRADPHGKSSNILYACWSSTKTISIWLVFSVEQSNIVSNGPAKSRGLGMAWYHHQNEAFSELNSKL